MSPNAPLVSLLAAFTSALLGSLFAAADVAVTSLSSTRLAALIEQSDGPTKAGLERIQREDAKLRSRYLLGRVLATTLCTVLLVGFFQGLGSELAYFYGFLATGALTATLYEVSTSLGRKHADKAAPAAARFLRPIEIAMLPIAIPLGYLGSRLSHENEPDPRLTEAEVEIMVEEVERSGVVGREPAEIIRNVLEFADRTAGDVMISREKVVAIEVHTPLATVLEFVTESGHSRYPVFRDQLDNVVGLLYAKDLYKVFEEREGKKKALEQVIRGPANFVARSQPLSALLREMRGNRQHLAIVVDEFGAVSGIVTLEDVLEEIVGDIRDEHDEEAPIQDLGDGRIVADADVSIGDLSEYLGAEIQTEQQKSLGTMLTEHLGKIPEVGTAVSKFGMRFIVRDGSDKHIGKVEIVRQGSTPVGDAA